METSTRAQQPGTMYTAQQVPRATASSMSPHAPAQGAAAGGCDLAVHGAVGGPGRRHGALQREPARDATQHAPGQHALGHAMPGAVSQGLHSNHSNGASIMQRGLPAHMLAPLTAPPAHRTQHAQPTPITSQLLMHGTSQSPAATKANTFNQPTGAAIGSRHMMQSTRVSHPLSQMLQLSAPSLCTPSTVMRPIAMRAGQVPRPIQALGDRNAIRPDMEARTAPAQMAHMYGPAGQWMSPFTCSLAAGQFQLSGGSLLPVSNKSTSVSDGNLVPASLQLSINLARGGSLPPQAMQTSYCGVVTQRPVQATPSSVPGMIQQPQMPVQYKSHAGMPPRGNSSRSADPFLSPPRHQMPVQYGQPIMPKLAAPAASASAVQPGRGSCSTHHADENIHHGLLPFCTTAPNAGAPACLNTPACLNMSHGKGGDGSSTDSPYGLPSMFSPPDFARLHAANMQCMLLSPGVKTSMAATATATATATTAATVPAGNSRRRSLAQQRWQSPFHAPQQGRLPQAPLGGGTLSSSMNHTATDQLTAQQLMRVPLIAQQGVQGAQHAQLAKGAQGPMGHVSARQRPLLTSPTGVFAKRPANQPSAAGTASSPWPGDPAGLFLPSCRPLEGLSSPSTTHGRPITTLDPSPRHTAQHGVSTHAASAPPAGPGFGIFSAAGLPWLLSSPSAAHLLASPSSTALTMLNEGNQGDFLSSLAGFFASPLQGMQPSLLQQLLLSSPQTGSAGAASKGGDVSFQLPPPAPLHLPSDIYVHDSLPAMGCISKGTGAAAPLPAAALLDFRMHACSMHPSGMHGMDEMLTQHPHHMLEQDHSGHAGIYGSQGADDLRHVQVQSQQAGPLAYHSMQYAAPAASDLTYLQGGLQPSVHAVQAGDGSHSSSMMSGTGIQAAGNAHITSQAPLSALHSQQSHTGEKQQQQQQQQHDQAFPHAPPTILRPAAIAAIPWNVSLPGMTAGLSRWQHTTTPSGEEYFKNGSDTGSGSISHGMWHTPTQLVHARPSIGQAGKTAFTALPTGLQAAAHKSGVYPPSYAGTPKPHHEADVIVSAAAAGSAGGGAGVGVGSGGAGEHVASEPHDNAPAARCMLDHESQNMKRMRDVESPHLISHGPPHKRQALAPSHTSNTRPPVLPVQAMAWPQPDLATHAMASAPAHASVAVDDTIDQDMLLAASTVAGPANGQASTLLSQLSDQPRPMGHCKTVRLPSGVTRWRRTRTALPGLTLVPPCTPGSPPAAMGAWVLVQPSVLQVEGLDRSGITLVQDGDVEMELVAPHGAGNAARSCLVRKGSWLGRAGTAPLRLPGVADACVPAPAQGQQQQQQPDMQQQKQKQQLEMQQQARTAVFSSTFGANPAAAGWDVCPNDFRATGAGEVAAPAAQGHGTPPPDPVSSQRRDSQGRKRPPAAVHAESAALALMCTPHPLLGSATYANPADGDHNDDETPMCMSKGMNAHEDEDMDCHEQLHPECNVLHGAQHTAPMHTAAAAMDAARQVALAVLQKAMQEQALSNAHQHARTHGSQRASCSTASRGHVLRPPGLSRPSMQDVGLATQLQPGMASQGTTTAAAAVVATVTSVGPIISHQAVPLHGAGAAPSTLHPVLQAASACADHAPVEHAPVPGVMGSSVTHTCNPSIPQRPTAATAYMVQGPSGNAAVQPNPAAMQLPPSAVRTAPAAGFSRQAAVPGAITAAVAAAAAAARSAMRRKLWPPPPADADALHEVVHAAHPAAVQLSACTGPSPGQGHAHATGDASSCPSQSHPQALQSSTNPTLPVVQAERQYNTNTAGNGTAGVLPGRSVVAPREEADRIVGAALHAAQAALRKAHAAGVVPMVM